MAQEVAMWQRLRWIISVLAAVGVLLRLARIVLAPEPPALPFDPIAYDRQRVRLEGAMTSLDSTVSRRGNPYHFFVLDTGRGSVVVFKFGSPTCGEGRRATVEGVFHHVYQRGDRTFTNEIDADSISCE
jgi:hypothetical protein